MTNPTNTLIAASAPTGWARIWMWISQVLDASVIEVSDGNYVGSI